MDSIRNFSIIAHIDHGKSTLSDRLIERCGGLSKREMSEQVLDSLEVERSRGITVKAQSVTLCYKAQDGVTYQFNLIDTPGHVDFSYEVSRSLAACEGALLVVDAAQGVEAQTVAVCYKAVDQRLEILPVLNKVDLPQADTDRVKLQIEDIIGLETEHSVEVSAKTGQGLEALLEALVHFIPPPQGDRQAELQALIIDSWFDEYVGVVSLVRIKHGVLKIKDRIKILSTQQEHSVDELGILTPKRVPKDALHAGEVGYVIAGIKAIDGAPVGDTITLNQYTATQALPGFQKVKPQVFASLFPIHSDDYHAFRDALYKLRINDAALHIEPEQSEALGLGFRCGFLGVLHMEIVQQRLELEYDLSLMMTAPSVLYRIETKKGQTVYMNNPAQLPDAMSIRCWYEPMLRVHILLPPEYIGPVMQLCIERRGEPLDCSYPAQQAALVYRMPMSEVILDFFDRLKSISRGYASLDYHPDGFREADLVPLNLFINGEKVSALTTIVHRERAYRYGRALTEKLKACIPSQMFAVAIQAAVGSQIIARQTVKALRKNVTAKCYGGDISRKKKLLEKQKQGKKRMKQIGKVHVPQSAFLSVLRVYDADTS